MGKRNRELSPMEAAMMINPEKALKVSIPYINKGKVVDAKNINDYDTKVRALKETKVADKEMGVYHKGVDPKIYYEQFKHSICSQYSHTPWKYPSSEMLEQAIDDYFRLVLENHINPTVAGLCSWLGIDIRTLKRWENNQNTMPYFPVMANAVAFIHALIEQGAINGAVPAVTYMFNGKNYFGMKDETKVEVVGSTSYNEFERESIINDLPTDIEDIDYEEVKEDKNE